jgi:hypothetical protein
MNSLIPNENFVRRFQCQNRGNIFKPTIGIESLHEVSNDGVRIVNFSTSKKILLSKVQCSHIVTFINLLGLVGFESYAAVIMNIAIF